MYSVFSALIIVIWFFLCQMVCSAEHVSLLRAPCGLQFLLLRLRRQRVGHFHDGREVTLILSVLAIRLDNYSPVCLDWILLCRKAASHGIS